MLKVLGKSTSINVRKVLWLCAELELPIEHEEWGSGTSRPIDTPAFRALNPNALVPVIVDQELVLWESNTICRYLAGKSRRTDLLPSTPAERARVEQWMDWQATDVNFSWRYAFVSLVRRHPDYQDQVALAKSAAEWNRLMQILDDQLTKTDRYVVGAEFTLADIVIGLSVNRWFLTPIERPQLAAVAAYLERLSSRPGFLKFGRNGIP